MLSIVFEGLPKEGEYDPNTWSSSDLGQAKKIEAEIFSIQSTLQNKTFMFNGDSTARFSLQEEIIVLRDGVYKFMTPADIKAGDKIVYTSDEESQYLEVNSVDEINESSVVYRFYTDPDVLVLGESFIIRN